MYVLVRFDNISVKVYPAKSVTIKNDNKCIVKDKGSKYEATFMMMHESKAYLDKYSKNLKAPAMMTEIRENKTSLDLSSFSIGSELLDLHASNSLSVEVSQINMSERQVDVTDSLTDYTDCSDDDPTFKPIEEPGSDFEGDSNPEMENVCDMSAANIKENVSSNSLEMSVNSTINTCDVENLIVGVSKATGGNEKFNVCKFCNKKQKKIARHLETVHKDEEEVKKFKDLPKGSTERLKVIGILRKQGNFNYNTKVSVNDGNLIVSRRPNAKKKREAKHYLPCAKCKGFYSRNSLRVHFRICAGISSMRTRYVTVMGKKIVARLHHIASKTVREKLFPPLREDEPVRLIRYDELVILYANKMCEKYRNERYFEMIRQRIRLIGRFLMIIKTFNNEIQHLETVFDPKYCKDVIRSINKLAGSNETGHFENPTVASSLASLLKYISKILISECIVNHDDVKRKNAKNFLALLTQEIDINITRTVTESQVQLRRQKAVELPSTSDIKAFYSYLKDKSEEAFQKLSDSFSRNTWCKLAEVTLLSVQIFNRRRPGELERILIEDFNRYESINVFDEDLQLSEQNKETAKRYVRFLIRGKLNRTVPVILDKRQVRSIELLLKFRKHAKIAENNPYIFAAPGVKSTRYLRACNLIRKYASLCGAQHPERLRGTKLRKHIATTCLKLNLEEEQVKELANFMGHDVSIHKNIYRQPLVTHDILRMSKLLEAAQGREDEMENSSDESNEERVEQTTENPEKRSRKPINRTENKEKGAAKKKRSTSPYGSVRRRRWSEAESRTALNFFATYIERGKLPSFEEIKIAKQKCGPLNSRSSPQIKTWIHNQIKKKVL